MIPTGVLPREQPAADVVGAPVLGPPQGIGMPPTCMGCTRPPPAGAPPAPVPAPAGQSCGGGGSAAERFPPCCAWSPRCGLALQPGQEAVDAHWSGVLGSALPQLLGSAGPQLVPLVPALPCVAAVDTEEPAAVCTAGGNSPCTCRKVRTGEPGGFGSGCCGGGGGPAAALEAELPAGSAATAAAAPPGELLALTPWGSTAPWELPAPYCSVNGMPLVESQQAVEPPCSDVAVEGVVVVPCDCTLAGMLSAAPEAWLPALQPASGEFGRRAVEAALQGRPW